jgi:hypothetical protein
MLACCGAEKHQWEKHEVERVWLPRILRCFIVGENPGDTTSQYFYEPPETYASDAVVVRRALLRSLHEHALIPEATLAAFRDAGFLFDHATRCQLDSDTVSAERQKAIRYASRRVEDPVHLRSWLAKARMVWVMGHLASNAVGNATSEFPRQRRRISLPPFPASSASGSRFFLSEYLSWRTESKASRFCEAFGRFARERAALEDV